MMDKKVSRLRRALRSRAKIRELKVMRLSVHRHRAQNAAKTDQAAIQRGENGFCQPRPDAGARGGNVASR